MTTALEYITRSLKLANILGEGQVASAEQGQDGLVTLNDMIQSWNLDGLMVYQTTNDIATLVAGQSIYTVGPGGNIPVDRPVQINSMYVEYQGVSFPVDEVNQDEYNLITLKAMSQVLPRFFLYLNTDPLGTLTLWPTPSLTLTMTFAVDRVLSVIPDLSTDLAFPPGYSKAIRTNLAVEMCNEYGKEPPPTTARMAKESKADIKRANRVTNVMQYDPSLIRSPGGMAAFLSGY